MKFDFTKGQKVKFEVYFYTFNTEDHYFCHSYEQAFRIYSTLKDGFPDARIRIFDL